MNMFLKKKMSFFNRQMKIELLEHTNFKNRPVGRISKSASPLHLFVTKKNLLLDKTDLKLHINAE